MDDTTDPADLGRDQPARAPSPEQRVTSRETLRRLVGRLDALGSRDRVLFQLIYVEQAEVSHIAEALGISRDAVYQGKRRLRQRLAALRDEVAP